MSTRFKESDADESTHKQAGAEELNHIRAINTLPEETPLVVETGYSLLQLICTAIAGGVVGCLLVLLGLVFVDPGIALFAGLSEGII